MGKSSEEANLFIILLAQSSEGLDQAGLTLNNINYNEGRGDLILQLGAKRSEELVQYAQILSRAGLDAEIGTISQEGDSVRGSIKIRTAGGAS